MATVRWTKKRGHWSSHTDSYHSALANFFGSGPKDIDLARYQHLNTKQPRGRRIEVVMLKQIITTQIVIRRRSSVIIDGHVLLPVPGHPSRVKEQPPIADFLVSQMGGAQICRMSGDARMDGGDILRLGNIFFVGRSTRTNDLGIEELRDLLSHLGHELRVIDIPKHALHLTSIASTPTDSIILAPEGYLPKDAFGELPEGCEVIWMPEDETYGCNTIGLPGGKVLIAEGYPTVNKTLSELGLETIALDFSEIRAADGSLTCCSLFY